MRQLKITKSITNRESPLIEKYFQEISKDELINEDEEVELAQRIKKGDNAALEKLIRANLRFVVSVAKQYQHKGLELPDLIAEGNLGLMKAAKRYDETKGFKFISYGVWWIRQSMIQAISTNARQIRLPLNKISSLNKREKIYEEFRLKEGRDPSYIEKEQISRKLNLTPELKGYEEKTSLEKDLHENDERNLANMLEDPDEQTDKKLVYDESLKRELDTLFNNFPNKKMVEVIKRSYGIGCTEYTLEEIAKEMNYSRERIRQLKDQGVRRLKNYAKENLKEYL